MRTDKEKAFKLRRQGKSYKEIHRELGMSVSTLSNWFKDEDFSEDIKVAIAKEAQKKSTKHLLSLNKARGVTLAAYYEQAENEAAQELKLHINNPLFVSAVAAYWGEGDRSGRGLVRLSNTDPQMIRLFIEFLTTICNVPPEKLRGALYIYPNLNEKDCKIFWSKKTGLKQFHKTQVLPSRHKTKRLPYGTCSVIVANTYLKKKIMLWIDQLPKMVLNTVPEK